MPYFRYIGEENADIRFHDGALRPVIGACNIQVMRANREHPELSQGFGFTYNHAPMLCRWHKRFFLMYLTSPVHEHDGLARAMLMESNDGTAWSFPRVAFPEIPVPPGVYLGKGKEHLVKDARTVVHHRMGFYHASNDVLLAMTFHGVSPDIHIAPNSGYGMGRVVRRIMADGYLGEIFVLRVNTQAGWKKEHFPYRWFEESEDPDFIEACHQVLEDRLANGAWWEEERLDAHFFPLKDIKAPSFCPLPDGKVGVIGKMGSSALSEDGGKTWTAPKRMEGLYTSMGKCAWTRTGDGRYLIAYNPSSDGQHRWPLGAILSDDGEAYDHLCCVAGEVSPMRYGGYLKNFGPNYIRGIMPGNDDSPDGYTWMAYSMNKEDIWVVRLPASIKWAEKEPVHDRFDDPTGRALERWHIHSPLWASVSLEEGALTMRDSDPYEYAKAVRVFPEAEKTVIRLCLQAQHLENGELQIDVSDKKGMNAAKILLKPDGKVYFRGGNGERPIGEYQNEERLTLSLMIDCREQRIQMEINGAESGAHPIMCPCRTVERLTLRTGPIRTWPTPEDNLKNICLPDLKDPGERGKEVIYRIQRLDVEANPRSIDNF